MGSEAIVLVASDSPSSAARIQAALLRQGVECPHSRIVSVELAASTSDEQKPAVIFVPLASDRLHALQSLRRLRASTAVKIVAVGTASSPKDVLDAIHAGANDYLDESDGFEAELSALLERLRMEEARQPKSGGVLTLVSASGGAGVSVLAVNLAGAIAQRYGECALLDFQHPCGDLQSLLNLKPQYTLSDLCKSATALDQAVLRQATVEHACGIRLLASSTTFGTPAPAAESILRIMQLASSLYSHVVIDLGRLGGAGSVCGGAKQRPRRDGRAA